MQIVKKLLDANHRILSYSKQVSKIHGISPVLLYLDCLRTSIAKNYSIRDYFLYQFYLLNRRGRRTFVGSHEMSRYYSSLPNDEAKKELSNKETALIKFARFVKRDWVGYEHSSSQDYTNFTGRHRQCVKKPVSSSGGHGIEIIDTEMIKGPVVDTIFEEIIVQHPSLQALNPNTVNTLRVLTSGQTVVGALLRFGGGGDAPSR
jgi:predicted ATP-grasp superfamily ATP-dependent carboligase